MTKLILLTFFLISSLSYGQSYEEKIAKKSYDCISKDTVTDNLEELLKRCIILSTIDVANNDPSEKENR